jgi:hypothetical protein
LGALVGVLAVIVAVIGTVSVHDSSGPAAPSEGLRVEGLDTRATYLRGCRSLRIDVSGVVRDAPGTVHYQLELEYTVVSASKPATRPRPQRAAGAIALGSDDTTLALTHTFPVPKRRVSRARVRTTVTDSHTRRFDLTEAVLPRRCRRPSPTR